MFTASRKLLTFTLLGSATATSAYFVRSQSRTMSLDAAEGVLSQKEFRKFKLLEVSAVTPDTKRFRFSTGDAKKPLNMNVASCLTVKATLDGKDVMRPYTPVTDSDTLGYFDLVIKVYPNGVLSKHFAALNVGDEIEAKGPWDKYKMEANKKKKIGMLAGGSGITPMIQVIQYILKNPEDKTQVTLVFANRSEDDIILRDLLDKWAADYPEKFKVYYMVDKTTNKDWKYGTGYITADILKKQMPAASDDNLIMVCGPPPFMKIISGDKAEDKTQGELSGFLKELNYTKEQVYKF